MKKKMILMVAFALMLSGCGASNKNDALRMTTEAAETYDFVTEASMDETGSAAESSRAKESATVNKASDRGKSEAASAEMSEDVADSLEATENKDDSKNLKVNEVKKEMLVYRGNVSVDTLNFDESVAAFKNVVNANGGFIFDENFTDNERVGGYYVIDEASKHKVYTATVRVPSNNYEQVMNGTTDLGDVRYKNSEVTNVTQEYSTYNSQLEIYEAEYKRYLKLLEDATSDEYALKIEQELFDLKLQIADLKSKIGNIEMDVAYSYITITICEVEEYVKEPEKPEPTDTFADRLKATCKYAVESFLQSLEDILFWLITNAATIIITIVIVVVLIVVSKKKIRKYKEKLKEKENLNLNQGYMVPPANMINVPVVPDMPQPINQNITADAGKKIAVEDNKEK